MRSKKLTSLMLTATMFAGLLAGCGNGGDDSKDPSPTPVPANSGDNDVSGNNEEQGGQETSALPAMTTEKITLTYMHFDNAQLVHYVGDKFMQKYPNITVKYQDFTTDGYNDSLMNMISAQKSPDCYMVLGNCDFGLSNGLYGDFTEYWEKDPENQNILSSINDYKIGYFGTDKKLATPIKCFPAALYTDLAIYEKLNITAPDPTLGNWKWDNLISAIQSTTNAAAGTYGFNQFYTPVTFYPISNNADCIGEFGWNGTTFNMDLWADGVNQWANLVNSGYRSPLQHTPENEAWTGDAGMWPAYSGKLGWQLDAYWTYLNLFDTPDYRNKGMEWVPYATPVNDAGTSFGVLDMGSISAGTAYPREAYELLKWMGWGTEGWQAKMEAYKTLTDDQGTPIYRMSMPIPLTLDQGVWDDYTQSFFPTAKTRTHESVDDPVNEEKLVTAEEDTKYGKYFDAYFASVTRPVPFGDVQIPGFAAFIGGVYNNTADGVGVEALVLDQGKNAQDYATEMAQKALEYNQQALAVAKQAYKDLYGIDLNYQVIE